jgi:soluble lytic murein transglycosylase-like protein
MNYKQFFEKVDSSISLAIDDIDTTFKNKMKYVYIVIFVLAGVSAWQYTKQSKLESQQIEILKTVKNIEIETVDGDYNRAIILTAVRQWDKSEYFNVVVTNAIMKYSKEYEIDPLLVYGIIAQESRFEHSVVNFYGAMGLMQVVPKIWEKELIKEGIINNRNDLLDPVKNIHAGCYIIKEHGYNLKKYSGGAKNYRQKVQAHMDKAKKIALQDA